MSFEKLKTRYKKQLKTRRLEVQEARRRKDLLVESVRIHLLPALIRQGFEPVPLVPSGPVDPELPSWGKLIRARETVVDLVEIQFSTSGRAAFRINACAVPKQGMMTPAGYRTAEECMKLGVCDLEMWAYPRWFIFFSLFSQGLWRFRSPGRSDYEKLALRVAGLLPELELALREGKLGPHMRRRVMKPLPPGVLERIERLKTQRASEK